MKDTTYLEKPILYNSAKEALANPNSFGLGELTNTTSAVVTNDLNEVPELELTYQVTNGDKIASLLTEDKVIQIDAGANYLRQLFRIDKPVKTMDGKITVHAIHIIGDLFFNTLKQEIVMQGVNPTQAMQELVRQLQEPLPITVESDIPTTTNINWQIDVQTNAQYALGGANNSLLQIYKGEYKFDNYHVSYRKNIGRRTNVTVEYGKNLTDLTQETEIANTYTAVRPWVKYTPQAETPAEGDDPTKVTETKQPDPIMITLPEVIVKTQYANRYEYVRILPLDLSQEFSSTETDSTKKQEQPTVEQIREKTLTYINSNKVGVPKVSWTIKYQQATQGIFAKMNRIDLGDYLSVYFEKQNVASEAEMTHYKWDALAHIYQEVTLGDKRFTTTDYQNTTSSAIDEVDKKVDDNKVEVDGKLNSQEAAAEAYRKKIQKIVDDTKNQMSNYINSGGNSVIQFLPDRNNPTAIKIVKPDSSYFLLNDLGLGYFNQNGLIKTAMDDQGRIGADYIVTNKLVGTEITGGTITGGTVTGSVYINSKDESKGYYSVLSPLGITLSGGAKDGYSNIIADGNLTIGGWTELRGNVNIRGNLWVDGTINGK